MSVRIPSFTQTAVVISLYILPAFFIFSLISKGILYLFFKELRKNPQKLVLLASFSFFFLVVIYNVFIYISDLTLGRAGFDTPFVTAFITSIGALIFCFLSLLLNLVVMKINKIGRPNNIIIFATSIIVFLLVFPKPMEWDLSYTQESRSFLSCSCLGKVYSEYEDSKCIGIPISCEIKKENVKCFHGITKNNEPCVIMNNY